MEQFTYDDLVMENEKLKNQLDKYKETVKLYEVHFEKANNEFRQMQEETRYMKQTTDELRTQMKKIISEYNNIVLKHKEIEEAFIDISYLAKTSPDGCIEKLSRYYDEFQRIVEQNIREEENMDKMRNFTIIKGGK